MRNVPHAYDTFANNNEYLVSHFKALPSLCYKRRGRAPLLGLSIFKYERYTI
jgi:hypothetical protein